MPEVYFARFLLSRDPNGRREKSCFGAWVSQFLISDLLRLGHATLYYDKLVGPTDLICYTDRWSGHVRSNTVYFWSALCWLNIKIPNHHQTSWKRTLSTTTATERQYLNITLIKLKWLKTAYNTRFLLVFFCLVRCVQPFGSLVITLKKLMTSKADKSTGALLIL